MATETLTIEVADSDGNVINSMQVDVDTSTSVTVTAGNTTTS